MGPRINRRATGQDFWIGSKWTRQTDRSADSSAIESMIYLITEESALRFLCPAHFNQAWDSRSISTVVGFRCITNHLAFRVLQGDRLKVPQSCNIALGDRASVNIQEVFRLNIPPTKYKIQCWVLLNPSQVISYAERWFHFEGTNLFVMLEVTCETLSWIEADRMFLLNKYMNSWLLMTIIIFFEISLMT